VTAKAINSGMGGSLRIAIKKRPAGSWNPSDGDHHLPFDIEPKEWEELFYEVLKAPPWEEYVNDSDIEEYHRHQEIRFKKYLATKGFQMLGRIWDIYHDAIFEPFEIDDLYEECSKINKMTYLQEMAAVIKLTQACKDALQLGSGIRLLSD
jgi:hypothetical protein